MLGAELAAPLEMPLEQADPLGGCLGRGDAPGVLLGADRGERIEAGELAPGARLPAERDLAVEYGVAYDTIRRATALLRDRGLIITIVGRGTYVTPED